MGADRRYQPTEEVRAACEWVARLRDAAREAESREEGRLQWEPGASASVSRARRKVWLRFEAAVQATADAVCRFEQRVTSDLGCSVVWGPSWEQGHAALAIGEAAQSRVTVGPWPVWRCACCGGAGSGGLSCMDCGASLDDHLRAEGRQRRDLLADMVRAGTVTAEAAADYLYEHDSRGLSPEAREEVARRTLEARLARYAPEPPVDCSLARSPPCPYGGQCEGPADCAPPGGCILHGAGSAARGLVLMARQIAARRD